VHMAGLKAGSVDYVELTSDNKILVKFYVLEKYKPKIRSDSSAQLIRPFVIGERVLELTVGSVESQEVAANAIIASRETMDLMAILNGKNLSQSLEVFSGLITNVKYLAEAFLSKERTESLVNSFDRIDPLLKNLNVMAVEMVKLSKQATKDENLGVVMRELAMTTKDINHMIPEMKEKAPHLAADMASLVKNMAEISQSFKAFVPALAEIAPDLPKSSRRAVEALDEAVVLIKAMQKSFMVRGSVKEVREEEAERDQTRKPASGK
jgi:phospholipid/cholesterol/gamma-HCH transport system substrate-binding protein